MTGIRRIGTLLVAVILVTTCSVVGASVEPPEPATGRDVAATELSGSVTTAENNTTVPRHADPALSQEDANSSDVRRWLSNRLISQLSGSTINLSRGEYEQARDLAGDDYNESLAKYVEVQVESPARGGNQTFSRAQENQQRYVTTVQEFRQTYERYREAKDEGNETRARQLARRLDEIASGVNRSSQELLEDYHELSDRENANLSASMREVNETQENVSDIQNRVRNREFVPTELTAESETNDVSFLEPISVSGRLTTENGSVVETESARFRIGSRTIATEVSDDGRFEFDYRPVLMALNASEVTVQYAPAEGSAYLGSNATVAVNVSQIEPTVELSEASEQAAFNETVFAAGNVSADGIAAGGVPVVLTVGDEKIAEAETGPNGTFRVEGELPLEIPAGDQELRVSLPIEDRALATAQKSADITVRNTEASLTLHAEPINRTQVRVTGQLGAERNVPLSERAVVVRADGAHVRTVTTNESGGYAAIVELPAATRENGTVTLVAVQDAADTNLASTRAKATVRIPYHWRFTEHVPWTAVGTVGVIALLVAGVFARSQPTWRRWLPFTEAKGDGRTRKDSGTSPTEETKRETGEESENDRPRELQRSLDAIRSDESVQTPERAVEAAYVAVREHLTDEQEGSSAKTHWEFYRAHEGELEPDEREALQRLTEQYERAAFSPQSTTETEATEAIEAGYIFDSRRSGE